MNNYLNHDIITSVFPIAVIEAALVCAANTVALGTNVKGDKNVNNIADSSGCNHNLHSV